MLGLEGCFLYTPRLLPEEKDKEPLATTGPSIMNLSAAGLGVSSTRIILKIKSSIVDTCLKLDAQIIK